MVLTPCAIEDINKMKRQAICVVGKIFIILLDFDSLAMITVHTERYGVFNTKPLPVVWGLYNKFFNKRNTIMVCLSENLYLLVTPTDSNT